MTRRLTTHLLATGLPLALLLPAAAHAEKVATQDAVGDVVTAAADDSSETLPAPEYAGVDVLGTTVAHGDRRLAVVVRFRALERDPFHITIIRVVTPEAKYDLAVERLGGRPIASLDRGRRAVECDGLKAKVDLGADTVSASMPASCLGSPRWVRLGVGAVAVAGDVEQPELGAAYADDGHRVGEIRDRLALGPKVRQG